jgi:hypothetical protein
MDLIFTRGYVSIEKPVAKFLSQRELFRAIRDAVRFKSYPIDLRAALFCGGEPVGR